MEVLGWILLGGAVGIIIASVIALRVGTKSEREKKEQTREYIRWMRQQRKRRAKERNK